MPTGDDSLPLPADLDEEGLRQLFQSFGIIDSCRVLRNARAQGYGFVKFSQQHEVRFGTPRTPLWSACCPYTGRKVPRTARYTRPPFQPQRSTQQQQVRRGRVHGALGSYHSTPYLHERRSTAPTSACLHGTDRITPRLPFTTLMATSFACRWHLQASWPLCLLGKVNHMTLVYIWHS